MLDLKPLFQEIVSKHTAYAKEAQANLQTLNRFAALAQSLADRLVGGLWSREVKRASAEARSEAYRDALLMVRSWANQRRPNAGA